MLVFEPWFTRLAGVLALIDRSFVATMADSPIVRSTIDLARDLGLLVCAEGVETEAIRAQLELIGCELAQGCGLCRPLPADRSAEAILRRASETDAAPLPEPIPLRAVGGGRAG
jgi:EAL domain-containing protein (putative c-di-GMP-specific phosphodiesterase class I)